MLINFSKLCRFFKSTKFSFEQYKNPILTKFCAADNCLKKKHPKLPFLGLFWEMLMKKKCVVSARAPLQSEFGAKGALRKFEGWSAKNGCHKKTAKRVPLVGEGVEHLRMTGVGVVT